MPRNARVVAAGLAYHITQRGTNRDKVFFSVADRSLYLRLLRENLDTCGVRILAYCSDDQPRPPRCRAGAREDSLAMLMARVNGRYAQAVNIRRGRCGRSWQARFHSCPMSEQHWLGGSALRRGEPVPGADGREARGLPLFKRLRRTCRKGRDRSGVLDMEYWMRAGGAETWRELHGAEEDGGACAAVAKMHLCRAVPFGDDTRCRDAGGSVWQKVATGGSTFGNKSRKLA